MSEEGCLKGSWLWGRLALGKTALDVMEYRYEGLIFNYIRMHSGVDLQLQVEYLRA
jgi:hypothetical protein